MTLFYKGMIPWNKGRAHPAGRNRTNFRPGNMPQTWRPIGSERIDRDGVRWLKVADTRTRRRDWRQFSVLLWEAWNGRKLPRGRFVIHADRNPDNWDPDSLLAVTRAENMRRNSYHRYPQPIPQLIQLRGALQRQINRRERNAAPNRGPERAPVRRAGRAQGQGKPDGHRARQSNRRRVSRDRGQRQGGV